jgi:hypothetical protein
MMQGAPKLSLYDCFSRSRYQVANIPRYQVIHQTQLIFKRCLSYLNDNHRNSILIYGDDRCLETTLGGCRCVLSPLSEVFTSPSGTPWDTEWVSEWLSLSAQSCEGRTVWRFLCDDIPQINWFWQVEKAYKIWFNNMTANLTLWRRPFEGLVPFLAHVGRKARFRNTPTEPIPSEYVTLIQPFTPELLDILCNLSSA